MDILHVVHGYFPALGGTERLMQGISENLVARHADRVTVYTTNCYNTEAFVDPSQPLLQPGESELNGVTVRRFPVFNRLGKPLYHLQRLAYELGLPGNQHLRTLYGGPMVPGLRQHIEAFDGDVVAAAAFPLLHMYTALRACRRSGKPLVFIGALHPLDKWGYDRPIIYRAIREADAYIALSDYERNHLISQHDVRPERITVIGAGIDVSPFQRADGDVVRRRHHLGDCPVIAFIGPQGWNKGIDTLVLSMKSVWQEIPDARLLIAGAPTHYTPHLRELIDTQLSPAEGDRVIRVNGFAEWEKPGLFATCDVFAYPSPHESFGVAFIEAWAAAKPVVGCDSGAVSTIIADGVNGLLVPAGHSAELSSALLRLLHSPALRRRMGRAGRRKVLERYTWDTVTSRWRDVYERALACHSKTA